MRILLLLLLICAPAWGQLAEIKSLTTNTTIEADKSSAPAAMVAAQICQEGFSGQIVEGGLSVVNSDQFCDLIRLSDVMLAASRVQQDLGNEEYAKLYMAQYHAALKDANSLIVNTSYSAYIGKVFTDLLVPLLVVIAAAVFL